MRKQRWWDAYTLFSFGLGLLMFALFAGALGSQRAAPRGDSSLVPAAMERVRAEEARCQTLPASEAVENPRTRRC